MKSLYEKIIRKIYSKIYFNSVPKRISTSLSDNQTYPQVCLEAGADYRRFNNFRRHPVYNGILEHVTESEGSKYLQYICKDKEIFGGIRDFKANDDYGNPSMYEYTDIGAISPTTLRYVKVLTDLKKYFGTLDDFKICEIGIGYGGQCRVVNAYYKPDIYWLVDIQPALCLAQRYLDNYILNSILKYKTMNELSSISCDLILSNYAFTELPRAIQDVYLTKVILNSKRGYITYNEITPREFNSYKADELIEMIPGSKMLNEEPLTGPKNCIIVWGDNS